MFVFKMACRSKHFHVVKEEEFVHGSVDDAVISIQQSRENTLDMPGFIEALARVAWTIMRQLSPTAISTAPVENIIKSVAARCDQLDVDHFLIRSHKIKEQLKPAVDAALRKYGGSDPSGLRKSKQSLAPSEFATLLRDCGLYDEIGGDSVGWCFWRIDHDVGEEEEEWGGQKEEPGRRRLASTALHRAFCCVSAFLIPDPLVSRHSERINVRLLPQAAHSLRCLITLFCIISAL